MANPTFIENLKNQRTVLSFTGSFIITKIELKPFKQKEGNFLTCILSDKTGSLPGIVWEDAVKKAAGLKEKMVVNIKGENNWYNDNQQIVIVNIVEAQKYEIIDYVSSLDKDRALLIKKKLIEKSKEIADPIYKKVWQKILQGKYASLFWISPGGKGDKIHHAYLYGLIEHVYQMLQSCDSYIEEYKLDKDLIYTGILVHDIGKIHAYQWDLVIEMTTKGRLLGHPALGVQIISDLFRKEPKYLAEDKIMKLMHIIMSHHGEFGGEIKPQFKEALIISNIDGANATIMRAIEIEREIPEGENWSKYDKLTERYIYKG